MSNLVKYKRYAISANFFFGYTTFYYWSTIELWELNLSQYHDAWSEFDKFNLRIVEAYTSISALIVTIALLIAVFCSPCIYLSWKKSMLRDQARVRMFSNLVGIMITSHHLDQQSECAICMNDYAEKDYVISLPCDSSHFFHTACIA